MVIVSPQDLGLFPFQMAQMAYKWGWSDDHLQVLGAHPPSTLSVSPPVVGWGLALPDTWHAIATSKANLPTAPLEGWGVEREGFCLEMRGRKPKKKVVSWQFCVSENVTFFGMVKAMVMLVTFKDRLDKVWSRLESPGWYILGVAPKDYSIFNRSSQPKPSLATVTG